ncbi:MAG TPA: DUF4870 domain-containing protein [Leptolyngbyaceae cyanobacterium M65_K2018_010]|nr:DUF4870 domain-containing protein [Leptolyngbyaceae cyanobacterium M65_K2018_010]
MAQPISTPESRQWATLAHLSALSGLIIPFGCIVGPLIIWLIKREEMPFVDHQGKEALNFNLSMTIYMMVAAILIFVLIGIPLVILLAVTWIVLVVWAAVKAKEGIAYRYPLTLRLIQ